MLKKKNIFVAILSFIFCLSMFGGFTRFSSGDGLNVANAIGNVPNFESSESGDGLVYNDETKTLTLSGMNLDEPIEMDEKNIIFDLNGSDNEIDVSNYDFQVSALVFIESHVEIVGEGSLVLITKSGKDAIDSSNMYPIELGEGIKAVDADGVEFEEDDFMSGFSGESYVKFYSEETLGGGELPPINSPSKSEVDITATDKTISYAGSTYDVSNMFDFNSDGVGEITYSLSSEGLSGDIATGTLNGSNLTISKCGTVKVKVQVAENETYSATEKTATLTINRINLDVGDGESQLKVVLSWGNVEGDEVFLEGWNELDIYHVTPEVRNNVGGGDVTFKYWTDEACTIPTTVASHGADEENGAPMVMGEYYVEAQIAETNFYNAASATMKIKVTKNIPFEEVSEAASIDYNQIVDGKYDLSNLIEIDQELLAFVDSIKYYHRVGELEYVQIEDGMLAIPSINGDDDVYQIGIRIYAKEGSLYDNAIYEVGLVVNKVYVNSGKIKAEDKVADNTPYNGVTVGDNPFNGTVTISYFLDAECTEPVTENGGIPVSVGMYYANIVVAETNYTKMTSIILPFEIKATQIEQIYWDEDNFVYNGQIQEIKAYYLDSDSEKVYLRVSVDSEFKNVKESGYYTATATFANGETIYALPENTKQYQMKPKQITVTVYDRASYFGADATSLYAEVETGEVFEGDIAYTLSIKTLGEITSTTQVGRYEIVLESDNINYAVTSNTAYYYVENKIKTADMIENWVYLQTPSEPFAKDELGSQIVFTYYTYSDIPEQRVLLAQKPEQPGLYYLCANVESSNEWERAYKEELFKIDKIQVAVPQADTTVYTYNHLPQEYKVTDIDQLNRDLYTVGETSFRDAGTHKIQLTINDYDIYQWPNGERVYEFDFVIHKKAIEKPVADSRVFKYNGNAQTYVIASNAEYNVSSNVTQTNVGRYKIIVSLADSNNTEWSDGTTDNLEFDFVINQNQITDASIKDSNGNNLDSKDVLVIGVSGGGLSPEIQLEAEIFDTKDKEELKTIKVQLGSLMKKYDKIFKVADVSLMLNGDDIQPENNITLKMLVPEELVNTNFRLYHIHIDENGREVVSEIDYSAVDEDGYIIFQTNKLSSFVFVYKQTSLVGLIVTFVVLTVIMIALLVLQLIWFKKNKSSAKTVVASAVPVFYVAGELGSTIAFAVMFGLLLIANAVLLALNLNLKRKKVETKKPSKKTSKAK